MLKNIKGLGFKHYLNKIEDRCLIIYYPKTIHELKSIYSQSAANSKNKIILLYGLHEPMEPTSIIVEKLKLPNEIIAIRHPFNNTPRGVYLNIGKDIDVLISNNKKHIQKKIIDKFSLMEESFARYPEKIGDVMTKYSLNYKAELNDYFVSDFDLINNADDKEALTILIHGDTNGCHATQWYYGYIRNNCSKFNMFNCSKPKKGRRIQKMKSCFSGCPSDYLVMEFVFPYRYLLRDFETSISEKQKEHLYKAYAFVGPSLAEQNTKHDQHNWTYASQSYNNNKLRLDWVNKRVHALEDYSVQFIKPV